MTEKIYFSVSKEFKKEMEEIAEEKTKNRTFSAFITQAVIEKRQRESQKVLDDFQTPNLELDFLPKVNELVTIDHLKQLNGVDLGRLQKMMNYNLSVVKKFVDSHEQREDFIGK